MCAPDQVDNQQFQQILAYQFVMRFLFLHFREQPIHKIDKLGMIIPAVENNVLVIPFKRKIKPFHAQDDIFQRNLSHRTFRMGDIGVYDNEIILFYRINLIFYQIIPVPLFNIA